MVRLKPSAEESPSRRNRGDGDFGVFPPSGSSPKGSSLKSQNNSSTARALTSDKSSSSAVNWPVVAASLVAIAGILTLRMREEQFNLGGGLSRQDNVDYYAVLGLDSSSDSDRIKSAYRRLSLRWHPDKNPGCETCVERFQEITKAYEVLGDSEKRKVYDETAGGSYESIPSATISLTDDNYQRYVLDTDHVWVIQVYSHTNGLCQHFAPIWEEAASQLGEFMRFGRIDKLTQKRAHGMVPLKSPVLPAITLFSKHQTPVLYGGLFNQDVAELLDFLKSNYPNFLHRLGTQGSMEPPEAFLLTRDRLRGKLLLISDETFADDGGDHFTLLMRSVAFQYKGVFKVGHMSRDQLTKHFKNLWKVDDGKPILLAFPTRPSLNYVASTELLRPLSRGQIDAAIQKLQLSTTPYLQQGNLENLCRLAGVHRVYCLLLVNVPDQMVEDLTEKLSLARLEYRQTPGGQSENPEEDEEELYVQPVRVLAVPPWTSYLPPMYENERFLRFWVRHCKRAPMILLDMDSKRYTTVKRQELEDIYFKLENNEMNLQALPEQCSESSCFVEPRLVESLYGIVTSATITSTLVLLGFALLIMAITGLCDCSGLLMVSVVLPLIGICVTKYSPVLLLL